MKKKDVNVGGTYLAKVTDKVVSVRLDAENPHGGWDGTNLATGKKVRIKSAQRLRGPARSKKAGEHQKAAAQAEKENARVQAERQASPDGQTASERAMEKVYDPNRCATPRCKGEPVMTYLDKPLCQKCWDRVAAKAAQEDVAETVAAIESGNLAEGVAIPTGQAPRSELTLEEADKLAKVCKAKKEKADKPKRVSALDAAAEVLKASDAPMRAKDMIEAMAARGLWSSPNGKTPEATLYSAILREINKAVATGTISRFRKTDRGMFTYNVAAK